MDPLFGIDEVCYLKELQYVSTNATVESMLVALNHMQVSVCYLQSRRGSSQMTGFHKNIISFPQDLTELKNYENFLTNLQVDDIVNVRDPTSTSQVRSLLRARVLALPPDGVDVSIYMPDGCLLDKRLQKVDVEQRFLLP